MAKEVILITGANGSLGQDLVSRMDLYESYDARFTTRETLDLNWPAQKINETLDAVKPSVIVNTAAFTAVDVCESNFDQAIAVNAEGPQKLAQWAHKNKAYLIQISTDYVFDGQKGSAYEVTDLPNPISIYGLSKLSGEKAVMAESADNSCIIRTSWLFGPGSKNFVQFVINAAKEGEPVNIAHDQIGTPTWTGNLCKIIFFVIDEKPKGLFHGCSQGAVSRCDQAKFIAEAMAVSPKFITPVPTQFFQFPAKRPPNTSMVPSFPNAITWQEATEKFLQTQGLIASHA
jgi:dTDP-4-dehydrorhamnose reductase